MVVNSFSVAPKEQKNPGGKEQIFLVIGSGKTSVDLGLLA
jgi:hypothetical protein